MAGTSSSELSTETEAAQRIWKSRKDRAQLGPTTSHYVWVGARWVRAIGDRLRARLISCHGVSLPLGKEVYLGELSGKTLKRRAGHLVWENTFPPTKLLMERVAGSFGDNCARC